MELVLVQPEADVSVNPDAAKGEVSSASLAAVVPKVLIGQSQMPAMAFGVGSAWLKTDDPEATKKFKGHWGMMNTLISGKKKICHAQHLGWFRFGFEISCAAFYSFCFRTSFVIIFYICIIQIHDHFSSDLRPTRGTLPKINTLSPEKGWFQKGTSLS